MIRPSALQLARHCDLSHVLAERYPSRNEATDRGNTVDGQATAELNGGLQATDVDAKAIVAWVRENFDDCDLRFQVPTELYDEDSGGLITRGTADMVAHTCTDLTVVDFKKREQMLAGRLAGPDDNDQTHAYAIAEATRLGVVSYRTCLLLFGDGEVEPLWSHSYTRGDWMTIYARIRDVNINQADNPKGTSGPHCMRCYSRVHCPHWALPAHQNPSELAALTANGQLTIDNAGRALMAVLALEEIAAQAKVRLRAFAESTGGSIIYGDRQWRRTLMPGRSSIDSAALKRDGLAEKYTRKGAPFEQWRWSKAK